MKLQVLFLAAIVLLVSASLPKNDEELRSSFEEFVGKYNKKYSTPQEYLNRMEVFRQNLQTIDDLNKENGATFSVNRFADLTPKEFKARYLTYKPNKNRPAQIDVWTPSEKDFEAIPSSFDWRNKGAVTKVKDQGQCGSCWAFSTAEEVESMWFLAGNQLTELSPQQIVSCDKGNGDQGCGGGDTVTAYAYVKSKGLETEAAYPYTSGDSGDDGTCKYSSSKVVGHISGFTYAAPPCKDSCTKQNETILEAALATKGPVSICVYAGSWQFYSSGVFRSSCPKAYDELDHCVQLVGYDRTGKTPYWIVRNSWAESWGIKGYIHIEFGKNLCGIADEATFAIPSKGLVEETKVISQN